MRVRIPAIELYAYRDRPDSPMYAGIWVGERNAEVAV